VPDATWTAPSSAIAPPVAERWPHRFELFGQEVQDDYAWLKAENWREVLKDGNTLPLPIRQHLERENAYTDSLLVDLGPLRETLVREMRGRIKEDDDTVPKPDGPFAYFTRHREGGEYPLICREPREGGETAILLDGDKEGDAHSYFDLQDAVHSPDHKLLAWSADIAGSELYTIRVRDLATGDDMADEIRATSGEIVWCLDSRTFYYVEIDENHRPARVRRHRLGQPQSEDELIYEETEVGWFIDVDSTTSGAFVVIGINDHETSEVWLLDRADPKAERRLVAARTPLVIYDVEHHGLDLIIRTNADGAEDFKLVTAPLADPTRENWRDLVPYRQGIMVLYQIALARHLVRLERQDANPRIIIREMWSGEEHAISSGGGVRAWPRCRLRVRHGHDPVRLLVHDDAERDLRLQPAHARAGPPQAPGDPERVRLRPLRHAPDFRERARRRDRADLARPPPRPEARRNRAVPLYGYGSYGSSMSASFRTNLLSLVDRGFVYAIAHVRGGTEKGWRWYMDGKREKKTNTFRTSSSAPRP
jgi:oligopeptidase B